MRRTSSSSHHPKHAQGWGYGAAGQQHAAYANTDADHHFWVQSDLHLSELHLSGNTAALAVYTITHIGCTELHLHRAEDPCQAPLLHPQPRHLEGRPPRPPLACFGRPPAHQAGHPSCAGACLCCLGLCWSPCLRLQPRLQLQATHVAGDRQGCACMDLSCWWLHHGACLCPHSHRCHNADIDMYTCATRQACTHDGHQD